MAMQSIVTISPAPLQTDRTLFRRAQALKPRASSLLTFQGRLLLFPNRKCARPRLSLSSISAPHGQQEPLRITVTPRFSGRPIWAYSRRTCIHTLRSLMINTLLPLQRAPRAQDTITFARSAGRSIYQRSSTAITLLIRLSITVQKPRHVPNRDTTPMTSVPFAAIQLMHISPRPDINT